MPSGTLHGNALRLSGLRRRLMRGRSPLFPPLEGASPLISVSGRKNAPHIAERARSLSLRPAKMHNFAFRVTYVTRGGNAPNIAGVREYLTLATSGRFILCLGFLFSFQIWGSLATSPNITVFKASTFELCHLYYFPFFSAGQDANLPYIGRVQTRESARSSPRILTGGATPTFPDQQSLWRQA